MSWLPIWSWFKRSGASNSDAEPKSNKNNRDRVYNNNNSSTSSQTISKERDLISRTKINETKLLLSSIKDLATTLENLPLDDLLSKPEPQLIKQDTAPAVDNSNNDDNSTNTNALPATDLASAAEETLSEEDQNSDQVSQESETLTIGSDDSPQDSDHSSQSSTSKSPGRGLVRGTGVSVSQHGDMLWDERRGWVSRSGHEDVLQVDLLDNITTHSTPLSADLPQDFVLKLNIDHLAQEHAQLGAWMQSRARADTDRSYLYLIRTMSIMKMVREVETVRRMMSDSDSDEDEVRVKARANYQAVQNAAQSGSDKPSRAMSDKLKQFVDERDEEDYMVLPDQPLKLVQQSASAPETVFPSELTVELDSKPSNGHAVPHQAQAASAAKNKNKRGKALKLVPAPATFSDELMFDDEPKQSSAVSAAASDKKDLSAFMDEEDEQPITPVTTTKASKMKLITLDSLQSASLPSRASAAVQTVHNTSKLSEDKQDDELFDDIELPSGADLKRRFKALRPNNTSAGTLVKRHSSGKINNSALEDWCEDDDDDVPLTTASSSANKSAVNKKSTRLNLLTVK